MKKTIAACLILAGCGNLDRVGRAPEFSPLDSSNERAAMYSALPESSEPATATSASSLWTAQRSSLLGDHRASHRGDILTVVVEIDDQATLKDSSGRTRKSTTTAGIPQLFGIPQRLDAAILPEGASSSSLVSTDSSSTFSGTGNITRNEKVTLRLAATIVEELPNGVLRIEGMQQVLVNEEMRDLLVTGYIRPDDISRQNEVNYDKIANAQISYGGRGTISDVQSPPWGQQVTDQILPF
ncbi:flagellar basal body L-ring protein FlgH [Stagnihabitans tardus]|uniref:Flagellar L-ring protein n=1 Tax=Stagnihabitans tardus TaxID=2699202 RepID=A0AAE4Y9I2_9RHOB|nr:flagellar basal body L-ring protein FlgH [Stagnihabitans tardus]NBZ87326.1 flagellar basal body L-ring protein FlgH [Stagnihabitans tardus]